MPRQLRRAQGRISRVWAMLMAETAYFEFAVGCVFMAWAGTLLSPPSTFAANHIYDSMAKIAGEGSWGLLAAIFGLSAWGALALDKPVLGRLALLGGVFYWGTVGVCIAVPLPDNTGGWTYLTVSLLCSLVYLFGRR